MKTKNLAAIALLAAMAAMPALAQAPKPERLRGVIEKVDGTTLTAKSDKGAEITLRLAGKLRVTYVEAASLSDIKPGDFIGSGAVPQPDGTQRAVEVHIFAESMRGTGEGFRPWTGAPNGSMTNGTVGATVASVNGQVLTVKYKEGEKQIVVPVGVPIVRLEPGNADAVKPGVAFTVVAALKAPDGSFDASSINIGRNGAVPP